MSEHTPSSFKEPQDKPSAPDAKALPTSAPGDKPSYLQRIRSRLKFFISRQDKSAQNEKQTAVATRPDLDKPRQLHTQFLPIDETPYLDRNIADTEPRKARIQAYLADVTHPLSVEPFLKQQLLNEGKATEYSIGFLLQKRMTDLQNTGTMISLRDEAQAMEQQYREQHPLPATVTERSFFRKAIALHNRMKAYAREYLIYHTGHVQLPDISGPTRNIIQELKGQIDRSVAIQRDKKDYKGSAQVHISLPKSKDMEAARWDREEISLTIDDKNKISDIQFDELFSFTKFCETAEQLKKAAAAGKLLTPSQHQLLDTTAKTTGSSQEIDGKRYVLPIAEFVHSLPKDLIEKIQGKSGSYTYATVQKIVRGVRLNTLTHDFGDSQVVINLDTTTISNEDVYRLIEAYIDAQKAYPRVPLADKNTSTH